MFKLYKTWRKAKDTFAKPSFKIYFGNWRKDPNLPVFRTGPIIYLCKKRKFHNYTHIVKDCVMICSGVTPWKYNGKEHSVKTYSYAPKHKLPKGIVVGQAVWNSNIRRKLKKWHLGWLPPQVTLPYWMRFKILNYDVGHKWKFDTIRYEWPPQLSIIAFGLSFTITLHAPIQDRFSCDDHYWESVLNYVCFQPGDLEETIQKTGIWRKYEGDNIIPYFATRPEYIVKEKQEEYNRIVTKIRKESQEEIL